MPDSSERVRSRKAEMKLILFQVTHPGDGQGLVEVFPPYHAEAPGGRPVQHHVEWHDPLTCPGRAVSSTEGKLESPELWEGWRL